MTSVSPPEPQGSERQDARVEQLNAWQKTIRFGFRLLYNEMAWTYDAVSWAVSMGEWRGWQRAALPFVKGNLVLEIGHGPGHMLAALHKAGLQVMGLDLSPSMGRLARDRVTVPLVRGMTQALPFQAEAFDTVLATFPTEYVVSPDTLAAVHRTLKPDGRFVIVPEGHLAGEGPLHRFISWLFAITGQREGPFAVDQSHNWPELSQWQQLLSQFDAAGFQIETRHIRLRRSMVTVVVAAKN